MFRPKTSMKLIDRGMKPLRVAIQSIKERGSYVKVGLLGDSKKDRRKEGPLTNVEIGMVHEFGAPAAGIPERSFIRSTFQAEKGYYKLLLRVLLGKVYAQKMTVEQALGILGARMASDIKRRITEGDGIPPPNTPEVFMRKLLGSKYAIANFNSTGTPPRPLVDTGQLVSSITWAVVMAGRKKKGEE